MHGQRALAVGAFFESAKSGAGGERRVAVDRRLPEQIMAQGVMIVEVFIALDEAQDALANELLLGVGDEARVAVVGQGLAQILDEPEACIHLADEQQAAVAGDLAALEGGLDFSAVEAVKMELGWVPVWHWRGFLWCFA